MANWYILAYYDELNNMRLFPEVLHVSAGDFSSTTLFPDPGYAGKQPELSGASATPCCR